MQAIIQSSVLTLSQMHDVSNLNINIKIIVNDAELTDSKQIANAFNAYFPTVGVNLANMIETVVKNPIVYIRTSISNSFFVSPVNATEIEREISCLKDNKSTGPLSLPVIIFKLAKHVISKPLVFNISFSLGIVPDSFKIANIIPIYKKTLSSLVRIIVPFHYSLFLVNF